jgi:signal transduction histidine kinase
MKMNKIIDKAFKFLRNVYFFRDLSDDEIRKLAEVCKEERFAKGDIIFLEGAKADYFYIVAEGTVEVWKDYYESRPDILALHGKGHLFGEMSLVDELPRSATVVARTGVKVFSIFRNEFLEILRGDSKIALSILKSLSAMVRKSNDHFVDGLRRKNIELQHANEDLKAVQEDLLRAERLSNLGKFSSLIIHDIRNPISILRGYAEMTLLHSADPERVGKYARGALKEIIRMDRLAGELLDYSRGEIRLNLSIVSLHQFFEKLKEGVGDSLDQARMGLVIKNSITGPVILDEERMLRVFINLCDNSRKAMAEGGAITITVDHTESSLIFIVEDTGKGMPRDVLEHIFEPFYSLSHRGGTGLGLVIVKNIIEAHDGSLSVRSKIDYGTTVEIRLPLRG